MASSLVVFCLLLKLYLAYPCSDCLRPYGLISNSSAYIPVGACPTGYIIDGINCKPNEVLIIDTKFSLGASFDSSIIGDFSTSSGVFKTVGNPFPTIDRGFYFPINSYLKTNNNIIPSPFIVIEFMVRLITYGDIIAVTGDSPFLNIGYTGDNDCLLVENINNLNLDKGIWIQIIFSVDHSFDNWFSTGIIYNDPNYYYTNIDGKNSISASNNSEIYTWTIGNAINGFSGFFYFLNIKNAFGSGYPSTITSPNICNPYFYFDESNCIYCTGCPTVGTWCIRSSSCSTCFKDTCSSCTGYNENECIEESCKYGLYTVEGYCIACPSLSSVTDDNECEIHLGEIFSVTFDTLSGIIYDKLNSVPVITGNSEAFYPNYDNEDPIAAMKRGFYFNGNSSVLRLPEYNIWTSPKLVLSLNWTVEIWINPKSDSGCFFSYEGPENTLISLCFSNSKIFVSKNSTFTYSFNIETRINIWKVLMISFEFNSYATLSVYIDNIELSKINNEDSIVPNYLENSYFEIGKSSKQYYTGFIYQLSVFSNKPNYYQRSHYYCEGSLINNCIINCNLHEFHIGPGVNDCNSCHSSCSEGCIRNDSCSLCTDPLCYECSDFNSESCNKCSSTIEPNGKCGCGFGTVLDYEVHECTICGETQFYNLLSCEDCPKLCTSCEDLDYCYQCVENAFFTDGKCICKPGHNGTEDCVKAEFQAQLIISEKNDVYIQFEDELLTKFDTSYISVITSKISVKSVKIEQLTSKKYSIKIDFSSAIPKETKITIQFNKLIFSVYNSYLTTTTLAGWLKSEDRALQDQKYFSDSKETSTSITIASVAASFGLSLGSPDPACLWSLINMIQMLCFISLSSLSLGPKFSGKLKGLAFYNPFPNIFSYFVPHTGGIRPFKNAYDYGYKDHLILFNLSEFILAFLTMLCLLAITFILSRLTKCKPFSYETIKKKINSALVDYHYGNFIRFWITCFLDVFSSALIGIITEGEFSLVGTINFTLCIILTIFIAITPLLFFYFTYKKRDQIFDKKSEIQLKWGTLFYEFRNDNNLGCIQFYFYFFIKRILYIIILLFLQDSPIVQASLIMTLLACNFVYLVKLRPYSEKVLNFSNCTSEFICIIIFVLLTVNQMKTSSSLRSNIDSVLVDLVNSIMGIQILSSVFVFVRSIVLKLKQRCNKNNSVLPENTKENIEISQIKKDELV